ncbi:MAG TPA: hypothetical protein VJZ94_00940 [Candidatus Paceibacterota bacterium]|nr:hypothetical protein [Candidatus Paceibacterota bacterium]
MSTNSVRDIQKHIVSGNFVEALALIRGLPPGEGNRCKACTSVLEGLTKAAHGPARDNGFCELITLLIEIGDGEQALKAIESIGRDSHLYHRVEEFRREVDALAVRQQAAIRQQD